MHSRWLCIRIIWVNVNEIVKIFRGRISRVGSPGSDLQVGSPGSDLQGRISRVGSPGSDLQGRISRVGSPGSDLQGRILYLKNTLRFSTRSDIEKVKHFGKKSKIVESGIRGCWEKSTKRLVPRKPCLALYTVGWKMDNILRYTCNWGHKMHLTCTRLVKYF